MFVSENVFHSAKNSKHTHISFLIVIRFDTKSFLIQLYSMCDMCVDVIH